jgi:YidC/Oxa1 family membrane protein insertase
VTSDSQEQNQRTMRAIILCVLVAVVYTQVFLNKKRPVEQAARPVSSPIAASSTPLNVAVNVQPTGPAQLVPANGPAVRHPGKSELAGSSATFIESAKTRIGITHLGARVIHFQLNEYKLKLGQPAALDMVDNPEGAALPLAVYAGLESDDLVAYSLVAVNGQAASGAGQTFTLAQGATLTLDFKGVLASGNGITKRLRFQEGSYLFDLEVLLEKKLPDGTTTWVEWSHFFPKIEDDPRLKLTHMTYLDGTNKIRQVPLAEISEGVRDFGTSIWASLGDIYFMATLIPSVGGRNTMLGREGDVLVSRVAGTTTGGNFKLYVGPKDYKTLQFVGDSLERSIDLGWFAFLAYPLLWFLHYLYLALGNYGLAIIALTLIVKSALLPLSKAGFHSMKKMQDVQPEMKALKERITDPTQLNQEVLALYQRKGVNPMGGCLPLVVQIPVFLGLYQALLNSIELRHAPFALWVRDLSAPEHLDLFGIGIPVMVLLMAASMIIQQWTTPTPTADPMQKKMMMFMPIVFAGMFIIFPMPAGLVLYWLVNNIISITQQVYMRNSEKGSSVYMATAITSACIFGVGYLLTLI